MGIQTIHQQPANERRPLTMLADTEIMSPMKLKFGSKTRELFGEERGVSPVIGVILMVAIVVILAAVIGFFVLGLGSEQNSAPQASFTFSSSGANTVITHDGGDTLDGSKVSIVGASPITGGAFPASISAGDSATVTTPASGTEIRIVYENDNGQTSTLASYTVP